jgi:hypothetical protein
MRNRKIRLGHVDQGCIPYQSILGARTGGLNHISERPSRPQTGASAPPASSPPTDARPEALQLMSGTLLPERRHALGDAQRPDDAIWVPNNHLRGVRAGAQGMSSAFGLGLPNLLRLLLPPTGNVRISTASVKFVRCRPSIIMFTISGASRVSRRTRPT